MEIDNTKQEITKNLNERSLNEQPVSENQLVYQNFATKPTDSFLGTISKLYKESPFKKKGSM